MKTSTVAVGLFAALASAHNAHHARHYQYRRDNTTMTEGPQTTLTVITTEVQTITSCAPVVTDCPANPTDIESLPESEKETFVVTNTVVLTETVCPVSDAPAISASVIQEALTSGIVGSTITGPLPTATKDVPQVTSSALAEGAYPVPTNVPATPEAPVEEPTTTTTATSTGTVTKTITLPDSTESASPGGGDSETGEDGSDVCTEKTVTVTAPASTVYITVGAEPTATGAVEEPATTEAPEEDDDEEDDEDDDEDDEDEDECLPESSITMTATATETAPYPTGNGTYPYLPGPTGFARFRR